MKKSKTWRVALVLSIVVVFCLGLTGITLARYVVGEMSKEEAEVSRWGVEIKISDSSDFKTEYEEVESDDQLSLESSSTDRLVAPGVTDKKGMTFTITGKPEVATKISVYMSVNSDVFVDDYYPIVFTLKHTKSASGAPMETVSGNLSAIEAAFEGWAETAYFEPNTDIENEFNLTWEWNFDNGDDNSKDTLLGSLAANGENGTYTSSNWSVNIDYDVSITVTQEQRKS